MSSASAAKKTLSLSRGLFGVPKEERKPEPKPREQEQQARKQPRG